MARPILILHVDDNGEDASLLSEVILEGDFDATLVSHSDPTLALRWLATADPLPDFILCDLRMPAMDGVAFLAAVAANPRTRTVPGALLTGIDSGADLDRVAAAGIHRVLRKPHDMPSYFALLRQIGEIVGRSRSGRYRIAGR